MKDLTVVFVTTVEVLGENALSGVILGVLVGWLAILGIDRRIGDLVRGWWPRTSRVPNSSGDT